jgi:AcrR family transcriptional regulator
MPKVLPEYLELRRQQILDAAAACFTRRGFHQATMQDICDEAELSPGAIYRYFRSKDEIIEAMCQRGLTDNTAAIQEAMAREGTQAVFNELIRLFFLELENLKSAEICAISIELVTEAPRNEQVREFLTNNNREVRAPLQQLIREAQRRGDIEPSLDCEAIVRVMVALYQGFLTQKLVEPELDVERYAEVLKALFGGTFWRGDTRPEPAGQVSPAAALQH